MYFVFVKAPDKLLTNVMPVQEVSFIPVNKRNRHGQWVVKVGLDQANRWICGQFYYDVHKRLALSDK